MEMEKSGLLMTWASSAAFTQYPIHVDEKDPRYTVISHLYKLLVTHENGVLLIVKLSCLWLSGHPSSLRASCVKVPSANLYPGPSLTGTNPTRPGAFPGANSPGPVADLYGTASQDSGVGNYISATSPQPGSGFSHSIAVSIFVLHHPLRHISPLSLMAKFILHLLNLFALPLITMKNAQRSLELSSS